ncbi:MAG: zinc ribbon domain-containing protein [Pseudomonadota bacterium]
MPIFNYQCKDCGEDFDYSIYHSEDSPTCPKCLSENLEKKVSGFSVGQRTEKLRTLHQVDKYCSTLTPLKNQGHLVGCARGYANKILKTYK